MKSSGFTLLELLVIIAIIGIIAALGISSFISYTNRLGADAAASDVLRAITDAKARVRRTNNNVTVEVSTVAAGGSFLIHVQDVNGASDKPIRVDSLSISCNPSCPLDAAGKASLTFRAPYGYSEKDFKVNIAYRSYARSAYFLGPTALYKVVK